MTQPARPIAIALARAAAPAAAPDTAPGRAAGAVPAVAALLFATVAWSSLFFVGHDVLRQLDPLWFTTVRYTLATAVLAVLLMLRGGPGTPRDCVRRAARRLASLGVAGYGVFSVLVFVGISLSVPSHGAVIMATMPFTTQLLRWALDGQRPTPRAMGAAVLALAGVATVAGLFGGSATAAGASAGRVLAGDGVTLAATLGWVFYTRGAASMPRLAPLQYTALTALAAWPVLFGTAVLASLAHVVRWPSAAVLVAEAPRLLYVAAVPTVGAVTAFNFGVRRLGATAGTLFLNVVPVSALAIGALRGQPPAAHEIVGAAVVVGALLAATWPVRSRAAA